jgi:hypothetical protein
MLIDRGDVMAAKDTARLSAKFQLSIRKIHPDGAALARGSGFRLHRQGRRHAARAGAEA